MKMEEENRLTRRRLLAKRQDLLREAWRQIREVAEETGTQADLGELASHTECEGVAVAITKSEDAQAEQVAEALEQLEAGKYGHCTRCGRKIGRVRLQVIPWATLCVRCQRMTENLPEIESAYSTTHWERAAAYEDYQEEHPALDARLTLAFGMHRRSA